ncbi:unnamed protein product, partial [Prorocentrum cordatum]
RPGAAAGAPPAGGSHGGRPSPRHSSCRRGGGRAPAGAFSLASHALGAAAGACVAACGGHGDGSAVACGDKVFGQCDVPALAAGGWKRPHGPAPERRRRRGLPAAGILSVCASSRRWWGGLTFAQVAAGGGYAALLESDGSAVACGLNREVQCDLLALVGGLAYAAHLLPALLLQASPDGDPVRFLTFSEAEPAAPRSRGPHGIGGARRAGLRQSAAAGAPAGGVGRRARQRDRPRAVRGVLR